MIKADPKSIINFMATHFDLLCSIFDLLDNNREIDFSILKEHLKVQNTDIEKQLFEYQIFIETGDSIQFKSEYFDFFVFLLQRYKPVLPETIEKYGQAIQELFIKIQGDDGTDSKYLGELIINLSNEINDFTDSVIQNTKSLLHESRVLKANIEEMDYPEKLAQASHLIENYITPLNSILDGQHSQSIFNILLKVSSYASFKVQDFANEGIRMKFVGLYRVARHSRSHLQEQSHILVKELLPLIERIKTESEYLTGFFRYLNNGNCYKHYQPPKLLAAQKRSPYAPEIFENTKSYFEKVKPSEPTYIEIADENDNIWVYDKQKHKSQLNQSLPVDNFYQWCKDQLSIENPKFTMTEYFMVTALYFEQGYKFDYQNKEVAIDFISEEQNIRLTVPVLRVTV